MRFIHLYTFLFLCRFSNKEEKLSRTEQNIVYIVAKVKNHKMDKMKALGLSIKNCGHKKCPLKTSNDPKTKQRLYTPLMYPIPDFHKELVRLDNHIRPTHKVKDNEEFKQLMKYAKISFVPGSLNSLLEIRANYQNPMKNTLCMENVKP